MSEDTPERPLWHLASEWSPPAADELFDETKLRPEYALQIIVAGAEWWYYAALIIAFADIGKHKIEPLPDGGKLRAMTATIFFAATSDRTSIIVRTGPYSMEMWTQILHKVDQFNRDTLAARHVAFGFTGEEVIARYYRIKSAGGKVTLNQLAKEHGFHPKYLSQVKAAYDRAGKWGSKGKKVR